MSPRCKPGLSRPCSTWKCPRQAIGFAMSVVGARVPLCGPCAEYATVHQTQGHKPFHERAWS